MSEDQHACLTSPATAWAEIERLRAENAELRAGNVAFRQAMGDLAEFLRKWVDSNA